jgi:GntR family transcriptional regulator/MocR family aminotransferase
MGTWELALALDRREPLPLFLQIARAIADAVRRGRLEPGAALPGSRRLAATLDVHRNTVLAAYEELAAEGWIRREAARGTFVSRELPDARPRQFAAAPVERSRDLIGFELGAGLPPMAFGARTPGVLAMFGGVPDRRLAPLAALGRAFRRALRGRRGAELLDYGDPRGLLRLRAALAAMLRSTRAVDAREDTLVVTRGSQQALDLIARALIVPGDVVAVEALGYRPAWEALRAAGARLHAIPVDDGGLRVESLATLAARERVRAVYLTPHHQYPTTATLTAGRRLALLELARARRIAVIEDDYDHEFHFEGRPILPLKSVDAAGVVVYLGTLSKILAPGLRIGYLVAPPALAERVVAHRAYSDRQGDHVIEHAVAELLEDGEVQRHARRARRIYAARRALLLERLRVELGAAVEVTPPLGGIALWARVQPELDADAWAERALAHGVEIYPARRYAFDGRARPFLRLGFAALDERELREAVRRLAAARPR